ncbi:uncharacterized protein LOC124750984 [Schistocerca piceifrons]|uniref:uncharacterized protein LOC124750984 n=1 Tax=Schistocerca piceifrons TaxID=274613 RepID=UPI001F5E90F9|nr:uncharacterized protein LOC124750984 [Schistocerca piceifrons]
MALHSRIKCHIAPWVAFFILQRRTIQELVKQLADTRKTYGRTQANHRVRDFYQRRATTIYRILQTFVVALVCLWVSAPLLHHKTTDDFPDSEEGDRRPPMPIWLPEQSPAFEIVFVVQALCGTMSQQLSLLLDTSFYKLTLLVTAELQVLNDNLAVLGRTGASTERKASFPTDVPGQKREEAAIQSIKQTAAPLTEHNDSPGKLLYMQFVVNVRHHQAIIK